MAKRNWIQDLKTRLDPASQEETGSSISKRDWIQDLKDQTGSRFSKRDWIQDLKNETGSRTSNETRFKISKRDWIQDLKTRLEGDWIQDLKTRLDPGSQKPDFVIRRDGRQDARSPFLENLMKLGNFVKDND